MKMRIFKEPTRPLSNRACYHASDQGEAPEGMTHIATVEHMDPIRCAELVDETIDRDMRATMEAFATNMGGRMKLGDPQLEIEQE